MIRRRVLLVTVLAVWFAAGWWAGRGRASGDLYGNIDLFLEVLHAVDDHYVDPIEPRQLVEGGVRGMLRDLDPYSQYLDAKAYQNTRGTLQGSFDGVGAEIGLRDGYPTVIAPLDDSPAWKAGLQPGDVILKVDGRAAFGWSLDDVASRLRGPAGTRIDVTVFRPGEPEDVTLTIARERITSHAVTAAFMAAPRAGYVRLSAFNERAGAELAGAIDTLRAAGARSLVLDLRGNPGGLVEQAVDVVEQFVPAGTVVVFTRGRGAAAEQKFLADRRQPELAWPLVVLVDEGSASASEIVAGALQDLDRALLIGGTTFGKGSVQNFFPLRGRNGALKLTTSLYQTPSGRSIHRVRPPSVADSSEEGDEDGGEERPAPAEADSAPRPVFRTASGRAVLGGGGVTPDVRVAADSLTGWARHIERQRLTYRFVSTTSLRPGPNGSLPSQAWDGFVAFLKGRGELADEATLAAERPKLERLLRRDLARRTGGAQLAARVQLEGDPVLRRALQTLAAARQARDVFAVAAPAPAPGTR